MWGGKGVVLQSVSSDVELRGEPRHTLQEGPWLAGNAFAKSGRKSASMCVEVESWSPWWLAVMS